MGQSIIIGWELNEDDHPMAWNRAAPPNLSALEPAEIVAVDSSDLQYNTCILARSGAGKSYLLGRLLEEIVFRTHINITILDPNADYVRLYETVAPQDGSYDPASRFGYLPTEPTSNEFRDHLNMQAFELRTAREIHNTSTNVKLSSLAVPWWYLDEGFFVDPTMSFALREAIRVSHVFAVSVASVWALGQMKQLGARDDVLLHLDFDYLTMCYRQERDMLQRMLATVEVDPSRTGAKESNIAAAVEAHRIIGQEDWRAYELRVRRLMLSGIITPDFRFRLDRPEPRVRIVDIASTSEQALVAEATLWEILHFAKGRYSRSLSTTDGNDPRLPAVVVIDEAHRLAPVEPLSTEEEGSRALIREILAEGRKYGLSTILVSQRPDKIDPIILGECQNLVLLGAQSVLLVTRAADLCGLDDSVRRHGERIVRLGRGTAIICGRWSKGRARFMYVAGRRTRESGTSIKW
jgi:hypothetical protein